MFAADDTLQTVLLDGDPCGTDWAVRHDGDMIELETMNGTVERVPSVRYREQVLQFVDKVEAYYLACMPKAIPEEEWNREGWPAFWNEWHRRREQEKVESEK